MKKLPALLLCSFALLFSDNSLFATVKKEVFAKYPNTYFVETGTYLGDGIKMALECGFSEIYSIELSPKYFTKGRARFKRFENVHVLLGDSGKILGQVIQTLNKPITFWLDGHWSAGDTAKGDSITPLMAELEFIKQHPIKTHTILIDDIRCLDQQGFEWLTMQEVVNKLKEINPNYKITFEDGIAPKDVLVAYIEKNG